MPIGGALAVWLALAPGASETGPQQRPLAEAMQVSEGPCIEHARLAQLTASWLGYEAIDRRLEIAVELHGDDSVAFELRNDGEVKVEREMPAPPDCADRHAALALAIAMAIDASVLAAAAPQTPPTPMPPTTEQVERDADAPELVARERAVAATPRTRIDVFAGAFAGFELVPGVSFGGRLGVGIGAAPWLDVEVEALAAGGLPFAIGPGEVQPTLAGGAVSVCPARRWSRFQLRLCVAAAGAAVVARGRGFDESRTITLPWVGGRATGDARFRIGEIVWLGIVAGFVAPIVRTEFNTRNEGGLQRDEREVAAAGGIAGIDLAIAIPR